jgi:hypothetical protein
MLTCQHEKEWRKIPQFTHLRHTRASSAVSGLAWFFYCGNDSVEQVAKEFKVSVETVVALGCILGIQPVQRQRHSQNRVVKINIKR